MKMKILTLILIIPFLPIKILGQSTVKIKLYAQEAAENLMKKISPNTGKNASYEIFDADYDSYKGEYTIEMSAKWQGSPCMVCDETTFEIKGFLTVKSDGSNPRFKQTYKNSAVEKSETWSKVGDGLIILANAIDEQNRQNQTTNTNSTSTSYNSKYTNSSSSKYGSFTDSRDGKTYKTVKIGNQIWLAENLAYRPTSGNYWFYDKNTISESFFMFNTGYFDFSKFGYLYDYFTAKDVCPVGWHLPTYNEWSELISFLGGTEIAGGKLKSTDNMWMNPNQGATNESGFSAYPGASYNGKIYSIKDNANFWSVGQDYDNATSLTLYSGSSQAKLWISDEKYGNSVRCIKNK